MATVLPIPEETKDIWGSLRELLMGSPPSVMTGTNNFGGKVVDSISEMLYPKDIKDAFVGGLAGLEPGMIAANYRPTLAIQELRKLMAEEMKSRGPVGQIWEHPKLVDESLAPEIKNSIYTTKTDPIDQILRGSWYRGMGPEERNAIGSEGSSISPQVWNRIVSEPGELGSLDINNRISLPFANEMGFPLSLHNAASKSNKLGEPAGVSISMLPTKAQQFSADEFIHRVLPRYGGSPVERTVNLMTPEGRKALNDAYDVVVNRKLPEYFHPEYVQYGQYGQGFSPIKTLNKWARTNPENFGAGLETVFRREIGSFNQALSQQLQSMGKRGILYNPQRWNEYEMLMLDPKYLLPLDYRKAGEYMIPGMSNRAGFQSGMDPSTGRILEMTATPGIQKGLDQIRDFMSQNKSRLGDIYSERSWTQRLSEDNKRRLLELIDPQYRETVGNQLYQ